MTRWTSDQRPTAVGMVKRGVRPPRPRPPPASRDRWVLATGRVGLRWAPLTVRLRTGAKVSPVTRPAQTSSHKASTYGERSVTGTPGGSKASKK